MHEGGIELGLVTRNIFVASYNQLGHCDLAMELDEEDGEYWNNSCCFYLRLQKFWGFLKTGTIGHWICSRICFRKRLSQLGLRTYDYKCNFSVYNFEIIR